MVKLTQNFISISADPGFDYGMMILSSSPDFVIWGNTLLIAGEAYNIDTSLIGNTSACYNASQLYPGTLYFPAVGCCSASCLPSSSVCGVAGSCTIPGSCANSQDGSCPPDSPLPPSDDPENCQGGKNPSHGGNNQVPLIVGVVLGVVAAVAIIVVSVYILKKRLATRQWTAYDKQAENENL